jgi:hypothetical protein
VVHVSGRRSTKRRKFEMDEILDLDCALTVSGW